MSGSLRLQITVLLLTMARTVWPAPEETKDAIAGGRLFLENKDARGSPVPARLELGGGTQLYHAPPACAGCHGSDAAGRSEGGRRAPSLQWHDLSKPWGQRFDDGRSRGPYDAASFHRAVTEGVDPSGNRLDPAMPRYSLSQAQSGALWLWLAAGAPAASPGVTRTSVRVGYRADTRQQAQREGLTALQAMLELANRNGGIHGRRIDLIDLESQPNADVLAVLCPLPLPASAESLPSSPVLLGCQDGDYADAKNRFALLPGIRERLAWLAQHAIATYRVEPGQLWRNGDPPPLLPPRVLLTHTLDRAFLARLDVWNHPGWRPVVLVANGEAMAAGAATLRPQWHLTHATVVGAFPLPPGAVEEGAAGVRAGRALGDLFIEALRRSGRDLDGARLRRALGNLERPATSGMPAIRFEPARATGLAGIHLAELDIQSGRWRPLIDWLTP